MKTVFFLAVLLMPLCLLSQKTNKTSDSLRYYSNQLSKLTRQTLDSLRNSEQYVSIVENMKRVSKNLRGYNGVIFSSEILHSNYKAFNQSLAKDSFPALNAFSSRFGFAFTFKKGRRISDLYFGIFGLNNKSNKGEQKVRTGLSNICQFNWGYDLIKSNLVSIYPYAGVSIRVSTLRYSAPVQLNPVYTNITNLTINNKTTDASSTKLGYELGLAFDFFLTKDRTVAFFTKAGTSGIIGSNTYKIYDVKYKPGIKQGDWLIGAGLKFVGPN